MKEPAGRFERVHIFGGPSLPSIEVPEFVRIFAPARCGDLVRENVPGNAIVVFIDGLFFQSPAVTHRDLLGLLTDGRLVLGASSMGAIRAVELRHHGMIGIGCIYESYLAGDLSDDGEVAEGVCPFTFQPLTVPMVRIRRALALAAKHGVEAAVLDLALFSATQIHFLERTMPFLTGTWSRVMAKTVLGLLVDLLRSPTSDVKADDALRAIGAALQIIYTGRYVDSQLAEIELYKAGGE